MKKSILAGLLAAMAASTASVPTFAQSAQAPVASAAAVEESANPLAASPFGGHVHALAVHPQSGDLLVGARPIYRSTDGGESWSALEGIPKSEDRANITSISIDPADPQVMYATGHGVGVVKSVDGGETWSSQSAGLEGMSTEGFAIDAEDPSKLYVWVLQEGLFRSTNAGASWQRVDDGPKQQEIRSLASVNSPTGMGGIWLYAGLDTGIVKSPDCFCGWDRLANEGLPEGRVYSLAVDPSNPEILYAGLRDGVYKSTDGAASWTQATDLVEDAVVAVNAGSPSEVYAVGADGTLVASTDGGQTWNSKGDDQ